MNRQRPFDGYCYWTSCGVSVLGFPLLVGYSIIFVMWVRGGEYESDELWYNIKNWRVFSLTKYYKKFKLLYIYI